MVQIKNNKYSNIIPTWKFFLLSVVTCNLYQYYWFYNNWSILKEYSYKYKKISPFLKTLCLFIPLYNIYIVFDQLISLNQLLERKKIKINELLLFLIFITYISIQLLQLLPRPYTYLVALSFLPFLIIQYHLNLFLQVTEVSTKKRFLSIAEVLFIWAGLFIWNFLVWFTLKYTYKLI